MMNPGFLVISLNRLTLEVRTLNALNPVRKMNNEKNAVKKTDVGKIFLKYGIVKNPIQAAAIYRELDNMEDHI